MEYWTEIPDEESFDRFREIIKDVRSGVTNSYKWYVNDVSPDDLAFSLDIRDGKVVDFGFCRVEWYEKNIGYEHKQLVEIEKICGVKTKGRRVSKGKKIIYDL